MLEYLKKIEGWYMYSIRLIIPLSVRSTFFLSMEFMDIFITAAHSTSTD